MSLKTKLRCWPTRRSSFPPKQLLRLSAKRGERLCCKTSIHDYDDDGDDDVHDHYHDDAGVDEDDNVQNYERK